MRRGNDNFFRVGMISLVIITIAVYLGFTKDIPFTTPFQVKATFESANSIRAGSPVRIAGVGVGKVASVEAAGAADAAVVTLSLDEEGLPIHADATAKIRPRIFLEGNFFVDLKPGTPQAATLDDGDMIPITQTSTPVQLDEVLTALQAPEREDLRTILDELGNGLKRGSKSLNRAYTDIGPAERATAIINESFLGTDAEGDLPRLISGLSRATEGLGANERQLGSLITDFSTTMGAFASQRDNLQLAIRELGPTLDTTNVALSRIDSALGPLRGFALDLVPGVRATPATLRAGFPWISETRRLLAKNELRGLARDLSPASRDTARFVENSLGLFPQANAFARCVTETLLPTGDVVIRDQFSTGQPNYRELAYGLVGLAGEGSSFDGNGPYVHFQPGGGGEPISMGPDSEIPLFANVFPGTRTQPASPGKRPPYVETVPCANSGVPALNGPASRTGSFGSPVATAAPTASPSPTATAVVTP